MRLISGLLAGVALAMLTIMLVEAINGVAFPTPAYDWTDADAGARLMAAMPSAAKWVVVAGWFALTAAVLFAVSPAMTRISASGQSASSDCPRMSIWMSLTKHIFIETSL